MIHQGADGSSRGCWKKAYLLRTLCGCTFLYTWQPTQGTLHFSTGSNLGALPSASAPWLLNSGSQRAMVWQSRLLQQRVCKCHMNLMPRSSSGWFHWQQDALHWRN
jgi:hypothetical protein